MKTRYLTATLLATMTLAAAPAAQAQTAPPAAPMASEAKLDSADRDFLENAAQAGNMEVAGSKLALEKARDPDVKAFAQKMIEEHGKAGQQLASLAQSKGYEAPTEPSLVQQAKLKALGLRDDSFDKAYIDEIGVSAHQDAVKLFEEASNEVKDPDVKQFATQTLPVLQQHLEMAQALQQRANAAKQ
ncbi:DUF4142 domain-containing protein [Achromobacter veterisilvae]|jgi:putative membrane protein|uniref:DUF4142 domain-containing protein n=1 Tax=Achromobacter veterisilvae TaxID=2069367 RepID=A0A446CGY0_9BURK|nr:MULTISPECIES: DUF4142 domain-containing protein [Achromobacter]MCW0206394.1 DUF4142 domain-containing protein [Achromobacter sp.]SSW67167.1 hypothetical protein AVE30378_02482 [Achromobacter veterisilvae]